MNINIVDLAKIVSALVAIIAAIYKVYKPIHEVLEQQKEMKAHTAEIDMSLLKLTIMNENMPLEERISAGDKYLNNGGNGAIKHFYTEELLTRLKKPPNNQ